MTTMEESNGRTGSEAPSSSSSDFYATNSPVHLANGTNAVGDPAVDQPGQADASDGPNEDDDQDSNASVDMVLSDSKSPTPGPPPKDTAHRESRAMPVAIAIATSQPPKRKLSEQGSSANETAQISTESSKKPKLSTTSSEDPVGEAYNVLELPVELWQQIFLHVSPNDLARCVRVCRTFKVFLTDTKAVPPIANKAEAKDLTKVRVFDSESIWAHSRKTFYPNMPRPLSRLTELQMLQLIGNLKCQFCGRDPITLLPTTPFNCGPGVHGVRVFWPFGIRSCGTCVEPNTLTVRFHCSHYCTQLADYVQDVELLQTLAGAIRGGLPYCFFTPELHFVPEIQRTQPGGIPAHLRVAKVYYKPDVWKLVNEQSNAINLGPGAAEEWKKGLITRGKEAMADAARWEQWAALMPQGIELSKVLREYDVPSFSASPGLPYSNSVVQHTLQPTTIVDGKQFSELCGHSVSVDAFLSNSLPASESSTKHKKLLSRPQSRHCSWNRNLTSCADSLPYPQPVPFAQPMSYSQPHMPMPDYATQSNGLAPYGAHQTHLQAVRPAKAKTAQDVEEALRTRRTEIERRCRELDPPLDPVVLQYMPSFRATMKIAQTMTEEFWENTLKPRILAEREAAEIAEHNRQGQLAYLQTAVPHSAQDEPFTRPAKDTYDKEYDLAQEPLRKRLGDYADDFIESHWKGGDLDKYNSPVFAVKVIEYVDRRYREDKLAGILPPPPRANLRSRQGTPIPEPFLSLDNMKWVFDNKIAPRTGAHGREVFLCSGCGHPGNKWLAFEGLIQHYGAKHTTAFSRGNIVVHWQTSEWPSDLPFIRDPSYYIKQPKRASDTKGHARRTPQTNNGPFNVPGSGRLLSESPYFSGQYHSPADGNGYYQPVADYSGYQHGQIQPQAASYGYSYQAPTSQDQNSEEAQLNALCYHMSETWDSLDGVKEGALLECVRVQTTIHHAVVKFVELFHNVPSLDLITEVLATKPEARPIKEANGLACKFCVAAQTDGSASYTSYYRRIQHVKLYNTSSLVSHFKIMHKDESKRRSIDWTTNMIELPELQLISNLIRAAGMDDKKLAIVAAAFPTAFPSSLPQIGYVSDNQAENPLANKMLDRYFKKKSEPPRKKKKGQHGTPAREESEPLPEAREDEYDPRRPMAFPVDERAARALPFGSSPHGVEAINLAPETLAAIRQLSGSHTQGLQSSVNNRAERSPSVGRAEPANSLPPSAGAPPDISAILAQLTGQVVQSTRQPSQPAVAPGYSRRQPSQQTATPPDTTTSRSSSQPKHMYAEQYGPPHRVSPRHYVDERPTSSRYSTQQAYGASAEPSPTYDGQAQSYNARQFEHNRMQPYAEPSHPATSYPPALYTQVYEEAPHYAQPAQHAPVYRQEPPGQYVHVLADREGYQPNIQYGHAPPQPMYVDEYGREVKLVPMDSAPAPVQYAPHPFEQQHPSYARHGAAAPDAYAGYAAAPQYAPQHLYDDRRPVYPGSPGSAAPGGAYAYSHPR